MNVLHSVLTELWCPHRTALQIIFNTTNYKNICIFCFEAIFILKIPEVISFCGLRPTLTVQQYRVLEVQPYGHSTTLTADSVKRKRSLHCSCIQSQSVAYRGGGV
jgi:hypothetical protein